MSATTLTAVGGGVLSALLYLLTVLGSPGAVMLAYLSPLPLFAVGLALGQPQALTAAIAGAISVGMAAGSATGILFILSNAAPAVLLVHYALISRPRAPGPPAWYPPGKLVALAAAFGAAAFLLVAIALSGQPGGPVAATRRFIETLLTAVLPPDMATPDGLAADLLAPSFPALVVTSWLLMTLANAAIAQGLLVRLGRNLRPTPDYAWLELPPALAAALALSGAVALVATGTPAFLGRNLFLILAVPYFLQGLAVVHAVLRGRPRRMLGLMLLYFSLVLFGWPAILLAGIGFFEQWAGLRRRFAGKAGPGG